MAVLVTNYNLFCVGFPAQLYGVKGEQGLRRVQLEEGGRSKTYPVELVCDLDNVVGNNEDKRNMEDPPKEVDDEFVKVSEIYRLVQARVTFPYDLPNPAKTYYCNLQESEINSLTLLYLEFYCPSYLCVLSFLISYLTLMALSF